MLDWIDAQIDAVPAGVTTFNGRGGAVVPASGDYTASQVGLGSVTNDAQLKRAGSDWGGFTTQTGAVGGDKLLIERASDSAKRVITASSFALPSDRQGLPFLMKPSSPDSWDFEARDATSADLATLGWTVTLSLSPWTVQTRAGDIDLSSDPSANTYRSTLIGGVLCLQFPPSKVLTMYKTVTSAAFTYALHAWTNMHFSSGNTDVVAFISDNTHRDASGARTYYTGTEGINATEFLLVGPSTFTALSTGTALDGQYDTIKYIHNPAAGNVMSTTHIQGSANARVMMGATSTMRNADRTVTITPTIAGVWVTTGTNRNLVFFDFARRFSLYKYLG